MVTMWQNSQADSGHLWRDRQRPSARLHATRVSWVVLAMMSLLVAAVPGDATAQERPFRLEGLDGGALGPGDFDRGVVIAVVWATWSPHSRDVVDQVNAIVDRWGGQARVIMIDFQEDPDEVRAFLNDKRTKAKVYLDQSGSFSKNYSVTHLPGLVIFRDGNAAFSGKLSRDPDSVIAQTLG